MTRWWRLAWLIGFALLLAGRFPASSYASLHCASNSAPGVVLAGFRDANSASEWQLEANRHALPFKVVSSNPKINVQVLRVPVGQECQAAEMLRRDPRVAFAELDYAARATDVITPCDPGWEQQWGPRQIQAPLAWDITTGTLSVTIALLDSGIDLDHPDLAGKIWTNPGEIPGNWKDDDGNGQVDDVHGWHFYHMWTGFTFVPAEDANVQDDYGHGTHVAGIAAAASNNDIGIAGVAWGARVMPVKVLDQYGSGWYSDIAAGIVYAVDNGAQIINLSLGGPPASEALCAAAIYAYHKGALLVAATGNSGGAVFYPAACDDVLGVAASDQADNRASFSNWGPQVDLAAPGVDIYSTWPWVNGYFIKSGTSMAAPHVSGAAALVWSHWPHLSNGVVAWQLTRTAVDLASPGWDEYLGWGRLDAQQAVTREIYQTFLPIVSEGDCTEMPR